MSEGITEVGKQSTQMTDVPKKTAGGSAAAGGFDYQNRVAAWLAVRVLGETAVPAQWGLTNPDTTLDFIRCETEQPVDDILAGTSNDGFLFFQVKKTVDLSANPESPLASTVAQFVSQYLLNRTQTSKKPKRAWDRPLDSSRDRLILVTSGQGSAKVRLTLAKVLDRVRTLHNRDSVEAAASSKEEKEVLDVLLGHIKTAWQKHASGTPSDEELTQCLGLLYVQTLDLDDGASDRNEAGNILRTAVLTDANQDQAAWSRLVAVCAELASKRTGLDRKGLQQQLLVASVTPLAAHSYAPDIEKLTKYSQRTCQSLADLAQIRCGDALIKIARESSADLISAAKERSLLVVGDPGAGKSGALHDLYEALREQDIDAVFLAADRLEAATFGALRNDIGLDHDLTEVLVSWPGDKPGVLIIDALDAARAEQSAKVLRELIHSVTASDSRWNVVASNPKV